MIGVFQAYCGSRADVCRAGLDVSWNNFLTLILSHSEEGVDLSICFGK